jgi:hypothetical protein
MTQTPRTNAKNLDMADNEEYCENCGDECDGCCGGTKKKYPTEKQQATDMVNMIMSHGYSMAQLVLSELQKRLETEAK